ncbi:hypothetical protein BDV34DRAFT_199009 [Aspergillus parasiticus]|uniref:Uncharacterized protein n=1 Tax=Aspergillus parasiticus TaxID=5067 RepID=A0A5N6DEB6_ASPPA|nr:hypothetical protein BDV34DRAFT_199009 [Aspergillus parasiticus]
MWRRREAPQHRIGLIQSILASRKGASSVVQLLNHYFSWVTGYVSPRFLPEGSLLSRSYIYTCFYSCLLQQL